VLFSFSGFSLFHHDGHDSHSVWQQDSAAAEMAQQQERAKDGRTLIEKVIPHVSLVSDFLATTCITSAACFLDPHGMLMHCPKSIDANINPSKQKTKIIIPQPQTEF